jgi:Ca2+:H+ antiporter
VQPASHTLLFGLSVLAIVPLASLLSRATESVASKTGDAVGGLLNATLGNLTELVIAITALRAGMFDLVKASVAGAIVTNSLFMLGMALLLGGIRYRTQTYNPGTVRLQAGLLFLATVALLIPSTIGQSGHPQAEALVDQLSIGLSVLLLVAYVLSLVFSLGTHPDLFASKGSEGAGHDEEPWPMGVALGLLAAVTVIVALVSEIFVESVQFAADSFGMSPAFVGFVVVAIVGAAAEMTAAFSAARKNRLDLAIGIALGSSAQIALFVAPVLVLLSLFIAPAPMDLQFWPGAVIMVTLSTLTVWFVSTTGASAWFLGVMLLVVYSAFAMTLYLLPPAG